MSELFNLKNITITFVAIEHTSAMKLVTSQSVTQRGDLEGAPHMFLKFIYIYNIRKMLHTQYHL